MNCSITLLMSLTGQIAPFVMWFWRIAISIKKCTPVEAKVSFVRKFEDRDNYKRNHECQY